MYKTFIRSDKQQPVFNTTSYPGPLLGVPNKDPGYEVVFNTADADASLEGAQKLLEIT